MALIDALHKKFTSQLYLLKQEGLIANNSGDYICPLCKLPFSLSNLSLEHAPQDSLGGKKIALTCKTCNNTCGHTIDSHLKNNIRNIEEVNFVAGSSRRVQIKEEGGTVNAKLEVGNTPEMKLTVPKKINNPSVLQKYLDRVKDDEIINIQNQSIKIEYRKVSAAILKNAYLILFAKFGYIFLLDDYYNRLREQIKQPDRYIIPDRLWTQQNISISDGVYHSANNLYRGFFVIYTLKLNATHRVCVCIPSPQIYYEQVTGYFRNHKASEPIYLKGVKDNDYFNDISAIKNIKHWLNNWD